ncbi:MAG TPA: circularly permuted type 2 ATP-grasp protein [Roseiarcus sp.]|nr:circularly permuted type 2 ATP-grasp protein [Roseiarcus sp.]
MASDLRSAKKPPPDRVAAWTANYRPLPGIPDEFIAADGERRPHWLRLLNALAALPPEEFEHRFAAADRRIRDLGVSYRVHGEAAERDWPLGRIPLLLPESEWREIARGVEQRAELLERLLADVYGEGRLVSEGVLPAAAIAGSKDYLPQMRGVKPPGGRWLRLYAAELGRGPDGRWWVLGDRTQAPSGAGYALENRLVISQAFPSLYREMNVERLAPFFREFRAGLRVGADRSDPRICILTPGPWSQTYFEQAYLARYLGFLLIEGADLVTSEDRMYVRTIAGLKRADVLWRHVDSDWCDPLELNPASRLGAPGMLDAIRANGVAVENMPGTGLIEARAMLAFLPGLARRLIGEDLIMPNIATWWCGQAEERDRVIASLGDIAISGAFTPGVPGFGGWPMVLGDELSADGKSELLRALNERGVDFVGQDIARLSTTPRWENGKLAPRPFVLRVYAAATPDGWRVMPGGFCRVSDNADARIVSMGEGVESADVWVLADKPVETTSLLPPPGSMRIVRLLGNLPSRAADNLFWFGRYLERGEATLRLVRCLCNRSVDLDASYGLARQSIDRLKSMLVAWGAVGAASVKRPAVEVSEIALRDEAHYGSALSIARAARHAASVIRERLTHDTWRLIGSFEALLAEAPDRALSEPEILDRAEGALTTIAALSGLFDENFNRGAGWFFYDIGRRVERGINTCRYARQFADREATAHNLDVLLDLIDSQITFRSRYLTGVAFAPVRDMAVLDPYNPRSVAFQVAAIDDHIAGLPTLNDDGVLEAPRRLSMQLRAELSTEDAARVDAQTILAFEQKLANLADAIATRYFLQNGQAPHPDKIIGLA